MLLLLLKLLSHVWLFATPRVARQASLSFTISWSLLKLMSIESVMPSNHLILCHSLLFPPSISPDIRVFSSYSHMHTHISEFRKTAGKETTSYVSLESYVLWASLYMIIFNHPVTLHVLSTFSFTSEGTDWNVSQHPRSPYSSWVAGERGSIKQPSVGTSEFGEDRPSPQRRSDIQKRNSMARA